MNNKTQILNEFRQSIRCGTGKAFLLMKKHYEINFINEIYKVSIKNYAYDGQSEGDRAEYIIHFIEILNLQEKNKLKEKLIIKLFEVNDDTWNLDQLFEICGYFAKTDESIKDKIYARFYETAIADSDWLGAETILKLDGVEGMKKIAEHFGNRLILNKKDWQDESILERFHQEYPELNTKDILIKKSKNNKAIKKYLLEIEATKKRWANTKAKKTVWTIENIIDHILDDNKKAPSFVAIRKLSNIEIKKIAKLFQEDLSEPKVQKLFYIFSLLKYPFNYLDLKLYLRSAYRLSKDNMHTALSFFPDVELRQMAIKKLLKTNNPCLYLPLLNSNYKKGDSKLFTEIINKFKNEHLIESLAGSIIEIYKNNKSKDCKSPLLALYEKMNCAICRFKILEILYENKVLPKSILMEMEFDSYEETRSLYQKIKMQ